MRQHSIHSHISSPWAKATEEDVDKDTAEDEAEVVEEAEVAEEASQAITVETGILGRELGSLIVLLGFAKNSMLIVPGVYDISFCVHSSVIALEMLVQRMLVIWIVETTWTVWILGVLVPKTQC
jgi:hypothetical protein